MFDTIKQTDRLDGAKHFMSFLFSLFAHATGVCIVAMLPLLFLKAVQPGGWETILTIGPPPAQLYPQPIPPRGATGSNRQKTQNVGPRLIDWTIAPSKPLIGVFPEPEYLGPINTGQLPIGISPEPGPGGEDNGINSNSIVQYTPRAPQKPIEPKIFKRPDSITIGGDIMAAKLIHKVDPEYPRLAIITRLSGTVMLEAIIDEEGNVTNPKIVDGDQIFNQAALDAVRQWKYSPTILNGEPIIIKTTIKVVFRIMH
jgi:periplasmic protein TonB